MLRLHKKWAGGPVMFSIISGLIVAGGGGAGLWYFMPHEGRPHPLTVKPLLDSLIAIVTALAIGTAMVISDLGLH